MRSKGYRNLCNADHLEGDRSKATHEIPEAPFGKAETVNAGLKHIICPYKHEKGQKAEGSLEVSSLIEFAKLCNS